MYPGRTTATLIGGIINLDPAIDVSPFIDASNEMVTEVCAPLTVTHADGTVVTAYSDHRLQMIETWLAAHFYACSIDLQGEVEQIGPIMDRFQGKTEYGLKNTFWGQQAMRIDTLGALAVLDNGDNKYAKVPPALLAGVSIGIKWLGTRCPRRVRGGWWPCP